MIIQPINDVAEICAQHGVQNVVLSPGSRCAPLTLAFARHPSIRIKVVPDERAAAFIGLGMAQALKKPVALVCTSGSAAYNYAPAVAEAFFSQVPLLVMTADRPPEWIDQRDGQTIRQQHLYGSHVKASFNFPDTFQHPDARWHAHRMISEAIMIANAAPAGPVQINIPVREPFYPAENEPFGYDDAVKIITEEKGSSILPSLALGDLADYWKGTGRILIIGGQALPNEKWQKNLKNLVESQKVVLAGDILSNLHAIPETIRKHETILSGASERLLESLQPQLLITYGQSVLVKNLKLFLRHFKPEQHWHIQEAGQVADTFQSLTRIIRVTPENFFNQLEELPAPEPFTLQKRDNYRTVWHTQEEVATRLFEESDNESRPFGEWEAVQKLMQRLPENAILHLANSMAVRYASLTSLQAQRYDVTTYANRGTSGIDGCTSTAVGHALCTQKPVVLITGDLAFFYDRNALWHNHLPNNLRILLLNNHAGGIFRLIDGPGRQPELEEYFETRQLLNAENTAQDFKMEYNRCRTREKFSTLLPLFLGEQQKASILEVETESPLNKEIFNAYKARTKQFFGH